MTITYFKRLRLSTYMEPEFGIIFQFAEIQSIAYFKEKVKSGNE
jgi:hypothetical protein